MSSLDVRVLDGDDLAPWDDLVAEADAGTVFHTSDWLGTAEDPVRVYTAWKGERLVGGLPTTIRTPYGLTLADTPPLTPYMGLVPGPQAGKRVTALSNVKKMGRVLAEALLEDADGFYHNFPPETTDLQPFLWEGFEASVRYTYRLDVSDLDAAWDGLDSSRRRDVRSAEDAGVAVEEGNLEEVLEMVERTYERQGESVTFADAARRREEAMSEEGRSRCFVARDAEDELVAGVYLVWDGKRSYYLMGGQVGEDGHHGAMTLAMWEAIRFTSEELGLDEFDFEGSMVPGIERFFRKFGGRLCPYYNVQHESTAARLARKGWGLLQRL